MLAVPLPPRLLISWKGSPWAWGAAREGFGPEAASSCICRMSFSASSSARSDQEEGCSRMFMLTSRISRGVERVIRPLVTLLMQKAVMLSCSLWMIFSFPSLSSPPVRLLMLSSPILLPVSPSSFSSPTLPARPVTVLGGLLLPKMYRMKMHWTGSWWIRYLQSLLMGPSPDPTDGKGVFCSSSMALYLLMMGPVAVLSEKQPGMKLSG